MTWRHLMRGGLRQIWRYRLRSMLVICCAALGVAGAVTSVNYASGGREQVLTRIQQLGTNLLVINAEQSRSVGGRERTGTIVTTLVEADYLALRREVEGIARSSAMVSAGLRLKAGYLSKVAPVLGVEPDFFAIKSWALASGDFFHTEDVRRSARVVLLGWQVARDLYGEENPVGERLFINRVPFEVAGVLAERGQGLDVINEDQQVYVPLTTAMRRLLDVDHYRSILLELKDSRDMVPVAADVTALLRVRHRISAFRPDDFSVGSQQDLIDTQLAAASRLGFLVRWIGFSGLVVSGLGVLAIAWISVRDRTREIGTRRALGARREDVFFQFAFEASVLATIGAGSGLGAGWLASRLAASQAQLPFIFELQNALLALGMAVVLNFVFASWPAIRAARMDPIKALRHE
ncbi:MAG: ABC transporter permease [Gammaproteobacteria bacterium]|jgi:putative ABC transport system permease protein|nr:ABC transporter permease [Gammaproteobacteria bacterium]